MISNANIDRQEESCLFQSSLQVATYKRDQAQLKFSKAKDQLEQTKAEIKQCLTNEDVAWQNYQLVKSINLSLVYKINQKIVDLNRRANRIHDQRSKSQHEHRQNKAILQERKEQNCRKRINTLVTQKDEYNAKISDALTAFKKCQSERINKHALVLARNKYRRAQIDLALANQTLADEKAKLLRNQ